MSDLSKRASMVCGICSQPLHRFLPMTSDGAFTGEVEYRHRSDKAHHEPAPQPAAEHFAADLDRVCDFCNGPEPVWNYRAPGVRMLALDADDKIAQEHVYSADWAACRTCAHLIERDMRRRLVDRVLTAWGEEEMRAHADGLIAAFFIQRQGKRRRLS